VNCAGLGSPRLMAKTLRIVLVRMLKPLKIYKPCIPARRNDCTGSSRFHFLPTHTGAGSVLVEHTGTIAGNMLTHQVIVFSDMGYRCSIMKQCSTVLLLSVPVKLNMYRYHGNPVSYEKMKFNLALSAGGRFLIPNAFISR
jgi:hypothetical protein